jgi:hypothetical protein
MLACHWRVTHKGSLTPMWSEGLLAGIIQSPSATARIWLSDLPPFLFFWKAEGVSILELYMERCTSYIVGIIKYEGFLILWLTPIISMVYGVQSTPLRVETWLIWNKASILVLYWVLLSLRSLIQFISFEGQIICHEMNYRDSPEKYTREVYGVPV